MHYLYLFVSFFENVRTFPPGGVNPGDEELLQGFSDVTAINLPKSSKTLGCAQGYFLCIFEVHPKGFN